MLSHIPATALSFVVVTSTTKSQPILDHFLACPYIPFSILCYGFKCASQEPVGYHVFYVHHGLGSSTLSFTLRKTSSLGLAHGPQPGNLSPSTHPWGCQTQHPPCRQAQGSGPGGLGASIPPNPGSHRSSTHCTGGLKDLDQVIQDPPGLIFKRQFMKVK